MNERPKVGIGVIVLKEDKVLLGKRMNSHGSGTWCFPGGHLEYKESFEECAKREVLEETSLEVTNIRRGPFTNDIFEEESKHYVTLYMIADYQSGEAKVCEANKCEKWEWFDWDKLPQPLFLPIENLLTLLQSPQPSAPQLENAHSTDQLTELDLHQELDR